MDSTRKTGIAMCGGALATALLVAWMIPSTTPRMPAGSPLGPALAARPVATPVVAGPAAAPLASLSLAVPVSDPRATANPIQPTAPPDAPVERLDPSEVSRVADDEPDRDYQRGYRWAAAREIEDPRDCDGIESDPGHAGCLAYIGDQRAAEERDDRGRL